ncbi:MAG: hypothetical protein HYX94_02330 [Chloroflexi bacterium]|nr:hypothetical protein [Chloroflexota bacterium]
MIKKMVATLGAAVAVHGWPAVAAADGDDIHVGSAHFDPVVGIFVGIFVALVTLMFVGQWVRFNAARHGPSTGRTRSAASRELVRSEEEGTNDSGESDD